MVVDFLPGLLLMKHTVCQWGRDFRPDYKVVAFKSYSNLYFNSQRFCLTLIIL